MTGRFPHEDMPAHNGDQNNGGRQMESSDEAEATGAEVKVNLEAWDWNADPKNPYNWSPRKKAWQVVMISLIAFLAYEVPRLTSS